MPKKVLKNACIECGGDITVSWTDRMSKEFALSVDVCPDCYNRPTKQEVNEKTLTPTVEQKG